MSWTNRIILAIFIAAAIAYFPAQEREHGGDVHRSLREREELAADNDELRQEIRLLEAEVEALRGASVEGRAPGGFDGLEREELARIARRDLNMIRSDEYVFELIEPDFEHPTRSDRR